MARMGSRWHEEKHGAPRDSVVTGGVRGRRGAVIVGGQKGTALCRTRMWAGSTRRGHGQQGTAWQIRGVSKTKRGR